ncbi:hypothetical protein HDV01_001699 [Terramyces sp. JEL0728]|nr:hypothetical protein HDV01_001699 [Terramyces sp. JEL0728]
MRGNTNQMGIALLKSQWDIFYNILLTVIACIVVVLYIVFYILTTIGMNSKHLCSSKIVMLNVIQAITISNMICWVPMIVFCSTTAAWYMAGFNESDPVYYFGLYIYNATASCKGLYHLISLYICERYNDCKDRAEKDVDTIQWSDDKLNYSLNDNTL